MQETVRELAVNESLNRSLSQILADLKTGGDAARLTKAEFASDSGKTKGKIMQDFLQRAAELMQEQRRPRQTFETEAWHAGNGTKKGKKDGFER